MLYEQKENNDNMLWFVTERLMLNKGMNQSGLAKKAKIHKTVISALKQGKIKKPSFELICKISDALEVSLEEFRIKDDVK